MVKFSNKLVPKTSKKKWDRVKKKRDSSKFWTKNRECPSKSRTVGEYGTTEQYHDVIGECHNIISYCLSCTFDHRWDTCSILSNNAYSL